MEGFALCWQPYSRGVKIDTYRGQPLDKSAIEARRIAANETDNIVFAQVLALAKELYPPFDPPTDPVKAPNKGMT